MIHYADFLQQYIYQLDGDSSADLGTEHEYSLADYQRGIDLLTPAQAQALLAYDPVVVQDLISVGINNYPDLPNNDLGQAVIAILSTMEF